MRIARRTGFLERDGEHLYFEVCGEGPPLVLSHGAGGNHAVWYQQVAFFAARRTVVTWDHRGFGRSSDRAAEGGPEVATGDLLALIDHLELSAADHVGQSMGGWTALGLALSAPGRVRRLVLADTLGGISTSRVREFLARMTGRRPRPQIPETLGAHPALDDGFADRDPARAHLYQMLGGFGEPDLARLFPRLQATRRGEVELRRLACPVLFVVGERDALFPPRAVRQAAAQIPGARVVQIPECGHSPYFEDPVTWNHEVEAFLAEEEASTSRR